MKTQDVRIYTAQRLHWLWALPDNQRRAELAKLRRFNALATAEEITEISHHLRGMIQLLSAAKDGGIPLDYPQLAAEVRAAASDLAALKFEVLEKVGEAVGNVQTYQL